jgi:tripartite-type tricarboxylate transporter receptor subunit TctC
LGITGYVALPSFAQSYPAKHITIVVPYSAGGNTDVTARRFAESLGHQLKVPIIIENRPGGATNIAAAYVARAPRDGHTLLLAPGTMTSVNPYLFRSLPFRLQDFAPITLITKQAFVLSSTRQLPIQSLADLVAYAKSKAEGVTYGHVGTGSVTHIVGEWIASALGIKATGIPYKGVAQSTIDLIAGRIDLQIDGISTAVPMHQAGKLRILASMGAERSILPVGIPTFQEAGYPGMYGYAFFGLMAPAGTPEAVINTLHAASKAAMATPEFNDYFATKGEEPSPSPTPQHYVAHLNAEAERWGRILKPMNIQLD